MNTHFTRYKLHIPGSAEITKTECRYAYEYTDGYIYAYEAIVLMIMRE